MVVTVEPLSEPIQLDPHRLEPQAGLQRTEANVNELLFICSFVTSSTGLSTMLRRSSNGHKDNAMAATMQRMLWIDATNIRASDATEGIGLFRDLLKTTS